MRINRCLPSAGRERNVAANRTGRISRRLVTAYAAVGLMLSGAVAAIPAAAHPDPKHGEQQVGGVGVLVNSPDDLAGFHQANHWSGSGPVADQTADLVYAGTGCSPVVYQQVDVDGKIAIVDDQLDSPIPGDVCPTYTFFQKAQAAEQAGAIGLIQVRRDDQVTGRNAVSSEIPVLELKNSDGQPIRNAVVDEDRTVNVSLTRITTVPTERLSDVPCVDGMAGPFECDGVDLLGFVPEDEFDSAGISDIWGWTDPEPGADGVHDEYVILGKTNGIAFFRVTDPSNAVYLGELPNPGLVHAVWHDIKVHDNHAFTVSESEQHGMTVFDLTRLRGVEEPREWDSDAHYRFNSAAHNIAINEDTGFAYIVGGNSGLVVPDQCLSGLHMVDINDPKNPTFAGCYLEEGGPGTAARVIGGPAEEASPAAYVHDTQCVVYDGPDERYTDREICFNAAETKIVIADVTNKAAPVTVGVTDYPDVGYAHQGWLTDDKGFLVVNDELDEINAQPEESGEPGMNTRTIVLDVRNLEDPKVHFEHFHDTVSPDHNNYVHDGLLYQSNYSSGLRVFDTAAINDPADPRLEPVGYFDTFPDHSGVTFDGTWSNYPFFSSGTIAVSGREEGLFLLRIADESTDLGVELTTARQPVRVRAAETGTAGLLVSNVGEAADTYQLTVSDLPEGWTATIDPKELTVASGSGGPAAVTIDVPPGERPGRTTFTVTATSTTDAEVSASAEVAVVVHE
ncbi:choice-of-anchor B family protein [Haloechinothrix salitolerans]|uniref:Choice-of-anchor B family protein n=1 Tax=Haloechinothrix salitolerans TaxID=926830 RepID=A0ABW2C104_9PSEU